MIIMLHWFIVLLDFIAIHLHMRKTHSGLFFCHLWWNLQNCLSKSNCGYENANCPSAFIDLDFFSFDGCKILQQTFIWNLHSPQSCIAAIADLGSSDCNHWYGSSFCSLMNFIHHPLNKDLTSIESKIISDKFGAACNWAELQLGYLKVRLAGKRSNAPIEYMAFKWAMQ